MVLLSSQMTEKLLKVFPMLVNYVEIQELRSYLLLGFSNKQSYFLNLTSPCRLLTGHRQSEEEWNNWFCS